MPLLSDSSLDNEDTRVYASPFAFLVAENQLPEAQYAALEADFPKYHGAGFFPYDAADCGERVQQLVAEGSEEHTSELQSLMRISYAVFCLKKKKQKTKKITQQYTV